MADIAALKKEKEALVAKREAIREENQSNFDYVELIKAKSVLKTGVIIWTAAIALVVMIAATLALCLVKPDASPMLMWLTAGVPFIAAITVAVVIFAQHEKYEDIYKTLDRDLADVRTEMFELKREIEKLDAEMADAE